MNFTTLFGFIGAVVVMLSSVYLAIDDPRVFIDPKSALIVFGGTIVASLICFPMHHITAMMKVFMKRIFGLNRRDYGALIEDIVGLSKARLKGKNSFDSEVNKIKDPFLKEGAELLFWAESDIPEDDLRDLLETRALTFYETYSNEAKIFRSMAKFPPAFGLIGTALGMVALLQSMSDPNAKDKLGPAMAIALITTIYGLATANFFVTPIAENLLKQTEEDRVARDIVVEGLMLVLEDKPPRFVHEKLNSFLLPSRRSQAMRG